MNKLQGFFALRESGLPCVPWMKYKLDSYLDPAILWTVRSAVAQGNDLNLPRKVGVTAEEAHAFAQKLLLELRSEDLVLYYPFFIAEKSGVVEVCDRRTVIEAVNGDLWNLVTYGIKDVTIIFEDDDLRFIGNQNFLTQVELFALIDHCLFCKKKFQGLLLQGKSLFLEWSFACKSDVNKKRLGQPALVFYEIRTV